MYLKTHAINDIKFKVFTKSKWNDCHFLLQETLNFFLSKENSTDTMLLYALILIKLHRKLNAQEKQVILSPKTYKIQNVLKLE